MSEIGLRLDPRELPPVEPVDPPSRLSMTLLRHGQRCKRAAYLYRLHGGGAPAHALDFGIAFHLFHERLMNDLIQMGEPNLYAAEAGEDPTHAKRNVASMAHAIVDEVLRDHPELTVPLEGKHGVDALREVCYHAAVGSNIDPGRVVAVEKTFALDLACGLQLIGKLDVMELMEDGSLSIADPKTQFFIPPQEDIEDGFQLKTYSVLAMFGQPLDSEGNPEPSLGRGVQLVHAREVYPRYLGDDGLMRERGTAFTRTELMDFRLDLERLGDDLLERFTETHLFPATPGSNCNTCPCPAECPLPSNLRGYMGAVEGREQAELAAQWVDRAEADVKQTKKALRGWCEENGPVRYGDKELGFHVTDTRRFDQEGLLEAARRGPVENPEDFVTTRPTTTFKAKKVKEGD